MEGGYNTIKGGGIVIYIDISQIGINSEIFKMVYNIDCGEVKGGYIMKVEVNW